MESQQSSSGSSTRVSVVPDLKTGDIDDANQDDHSHINISPESEDSKDSDSGRSDFAIAPPPIEPQRPKDPFELFSDTFIERQKKKATAKHLDISPAPIKNERKDLEADMRGALAAQYRRQTGDYVMGRSEIGRHDNKLLREYSSLAEVEADIAAWFGDFVHNCLLTLNDHVIAMHVPKSQPEDDLETEPGTPVNLGKTPTNLEPQQAKDRTVGSVEPRVLHRAELYTVPRSRADRALFPDGQAILEKTLICGSPLVTRYKTGSSSTEDDDHQPIFEMTSFYGMPPGVKAKKVHAFSRNFRAGLEESDLSVSDETLPAGHAIDIRSEAGCVLTIYSETIIEAIESVSDKADHLIYEGEAMIIPEPFCVLLQYRDQILLCRDMMRLSSSLQSLKDEPESAHITETEHQHHDQTRNQVESTSRAEHITKLYEVLDAQYLNQLGNAKDLASKTEPRCIFEWTWLLFKRGSLVYVQHKGRLEAYLVKSVELKGLFSHDPETRKPVVNPKWVSSKQRLKLRHRLEQIVLKLIYLEFDGELLRKRLKRVIITPFDGEQPIRDLPAFPVEHLHDPDGSMAARIFERGKRYVSLTKTSYCQHAGRTLSMPRKRVYGRVIVDTATYLQRGDSMLHGLEENYLPDHYDVYNPGAPSSEDSSDEERMGFSAIHWPRRGRYMQQKGKSKHRDRGIDPANQKDKEKLSREMYMICSSEVNAYILRERDWALVDVDNISDCEFDQRMIDDLVIGNEAKRLIQALSTTHQLDMESDAVGNMGIHRNQWMADIVPNKGEGQILLLHGKPGVGKTLTAECVAELTKRPLLAITSGDLGTDVPVLASKLNHWLRLGTIWNAVLLFDEADVYLESRQRGDLDQNSVVSVFLRALENYPGLLFLTTNRIGTFDEAILSRVHVVLHYPDLTDRERERIWETAFRRLADDRPDIKLGITLCSYAYHDDEVKALAWNGREIRNAFNTMIALAIWDARHHNKYTKDGCIEVRREHLQQVVNMSGSFKRYLLSLRGMDASMHAKMMSLRDDAFNIEMRP